MAAIWRDTVITSQEFHQNFPPLPAKASPPLLVDGLQVTSSSYAICWYADRQTSGDIKPKFKLVLKSKTDDEPLRALETPATCHLFRNLPTENCCVAVVEDVTDGGMTTGNLRVPFDLRPTGDKSDSKPFLVFTNGTALMRADNLNDYAMSVEPTQLAFMLPDERNITGGFIKRALDSCVLG